MTQNFLPSFKLDELVLVLKELKSQTKFDEYIYAIDFTVSGIEEIKIRSIFRFIYEYSKPEQKESFYDKHKGYKIKYSYLLDNFMENPNQKIVDEFIRHCNAYMDLDTRITTIEKIVLNDK